MARIIKHFFRSFLLFLFLFLPTKLSHACWFSVYEDPYYFFLMQPEIGPDKTLAPFFYSPRIYYRETGGMEIYRDNLNEWEKILGNGKVSRQSIYKALYETDPLEYFDGRGRLRGNSFLMELNREDNRPYKEYLDYAKRCERLINNTDPWELDGGYDHENLLTVINEGEGHLSSENNTFIRNRIAYLLLRISFYTGDTASVYRYYSRYLEPLKGSWLNYSARFYLSHWLDEDERALEFARLLDSAHDKRHRMIILFPVRETERLLQLTADNKLKANLLVMASLQNSWRASQEIQMIRTLDPGNKHILTLLLREVNKIENFIGTWDYTGGPPEAYKDGDWSVHRLQEDRRYARRFLNWLKDYAKAPDCSDRQLAYMCAGQIAALLGQGNEALYCTSVASANNTNDPDRRVQLALGNFIARFSADQGFADSTQQSYLEFIHTVRSNKGLSIDTATMMDQVTLYIGQTLIQRKMTFYGFFFMAKTCRPFGEAGPYRLNAYHCLWDNGRPADYDEIIRIIRSRKRTALENYLVEKPQTACMEYGEVSGESPETAWNINRIIDYKSSWYLRNDMLDSALVTLEQIPDSFWNTEPYNTYLTSDNPFVFDIFSATGNYPAENNKSYNKRQFVRRLITLKKDWNQHGKDEDLVLIANAYMNMTYWGNYWLVSDYSWFGYFEHDIPDNEYTRWYYGCRRALPYFRKCLELTSDKDIAHYCAYMITYCENRSLRNLKTFFDRNDPFAVFNRLKKQYPGKIKGDGELYYSNCEIYQEFVNRFQY